MNEPWIEIKTQTKKWPFNEVFFDNCMDALTNFFQFSQLPTVEKVEDIDEHVIAKQICDFYFLSLRKDTEINTFIISFINSFYFGQVSLVISISISFSARLSFLPFFKVFTFFHFDSGQYPTPGRTA